MQRRVCVCVCWCQSDLTEQNVLFLLLLSFLLIRPDLNEPITRQTLCFLLFTLKGHFTGRGHTASLCGSTQNPQTKKKKQDHILHIFIVLWQILEIQRQITGIKEEIMLERRLVLSPGGGWLLEWPPLLHNCCHLIIFISCTTYSGLFHTWDAPPPRVRPPHPPFLL